MKKKREIVKKSGRVAFLTSNWASEANPTLGCSIEISGDIYCRYVRVCLSYVKLTAQAELRGPCACSKSFFGG